MTAAAQVGPVAGQADRHDRGRTVVREQLGSPAGRVEGARLRTPDVPAPLPFTR
ncbi:hypothetical protein [Paractinoplanes abujensis]|uniref:Uncharacterized protein n=1 Tax=Paractinoplanes abujensis TaxID=882441 RepID=A0A7W7CN16_9ACTN|nr:hypothetical protein [Actinoplanes abujensis]MBB4691294.1 hypothetical protein [Actinoplanes abujensis]